MELTPSGLNTEHRTPNTALSRLYLELRFRDQDVPLFHYTGNDAMRHNYAGKTPRGGKIVWDLVQGWVPCDWKAEPGPNNGIIWDSTQIKHWSPGNRDNFCPYVWLGAEERGLAWFAGTDHGYVNDGQQAVQTLSREGDQVVLRVYFIQKPITFDKPLRYTFGLQASPTKPLRADWRTHKVPGGSGVAVHVWGGYICSDKYPDGRDFTIVDKLMEARKTGKVDEAWFSAKDKNRAWSDMKVHYESPWLGDVGNTAGHLANQKNYGDGKSGTATYFEEHVQYTRTSEWQVFQDEWSSSEFNRFQKDDGCASQAARSYRDFALHYANEWMKRGVGMYFDNTMHRVVDNPYNQDFIGRTITIWEQRDYYKRIWKVLTRLNLTGGTPYELDFTGHITNTQTTPQNTWFTATLDLEQPYRFDMSRPARNIPAGDASWMGAGKWWRLPFPPDYTRAMTISRTIGATPYIMFPLPNWGDYRDAAMRNSLTEENWNSDGGMQLVHEIARPSDAPGWGSTYEGPFHGIRLSDYLAWFGYGQSNVVVHNYWEEKPFVTVSDPLVTWLALERKVAGVGCQVSGGKPAGTAGSNSLNPEPRTPKPSFAGLLLLQSYKEDPVTVSVQYLGGGAMMDFFTREVFTADAQGAVKIPVAGLYGTRLLAVAKSRAELPAIPGAGDILVDDFELGMSAALKLPRGNMSVVADDRLSGNHVLRIPPGHPGVHQLVLQNPEAIPAGDATLSFKFRLPEAPKKTGRGGVLAVTYRSTRFYPNSQGYDLRLACDRAADGKLSWFIDKVTATRNNKPEPFTNIGIDLTGNTIPGIPVDTQWHRLTLQAKGARQTIRLDDTVVFEGDSDASLDNRFTLAPGWGWEASIPYVELDDLRLRK